jgi:hypothetical protein
LVWLAILGLNQSLVLEFSKHGEGAISQHIAFAGIAIDSGNVAGIIASIRDATTFSQDVKCPLFRLGNIHVVNPNAVIRMCRTSKPHRVLAKYLSPFDNRNTLLK